MLRIALSRDGDAAARHNRILWIKHSPIRCTLVVPCPHVATVACDGQHGRLPGHLSAQELIHIFVMLARWLECALWTAALVGERTFHTRRTLLDLCDSLLLETLGLAVLHLALLIVVRWRHVSLGLTPLLLHQLCSLRLVNR